MKTFITSRQFDISKVSQKNFCLSLFMFILLLGSGLRGFAATVTWAGGTGTEKDWTLASNWGGTVPATGDDVIFNTAGIITFSNMPASDSYSSLTISQGTVTIATASASSTFTIGVGSGIKFNIASGASLIIGDNTNITLATNSDATIAGTLIINTGRTYDTGTATNIKTTVTGTIINIGNIISTVSKLAFSANSNYEHKQNGGIIPLSSTWAISSTLKLTALTTTVPSNLNQAFGNVIWNSAAQTSPLSTPATGFTSTGDFVITSTGVSGSVILAASLTINNLHLLSVASGATLILPSTTTILGGTPTSTFTLSNGATLKIASVDGITSSGALGNIQTITRNFSTGANYVYNGTAQNTGNGLPNVVSSLSLEGTGIKTFTSATNVTNNLKILTGVSASLGSNNLNASTFTVNTTLGGYNGTWGSTASSATNKSALFFGSSGTGQLSVSASTCTGVTTASIISNNGPTICSGSNAAFTLNGTPNGIVTYNLNGGANTDVILDNSGAATITVSAAIATQVLNLVSAKNGVTFCPTLISGTSTVTVYHIPVINSPQPATTTLTYGANATYNVTATSDHATPATFQWEEKVGAGSWTTITNTSIYSGSTSNSLTLTKPGVALTGRWYRCVVTNPCGFATTDGLASLTVNARPITITANAKTKVYGVNTDPVLTATVTTGTIISGDVVGGLLTRASGQTVGTYAISKSSYTYGDNYIETYVGADLTITPASLTITADDKSKVYGTGVPTLSVSYTGLVNGDLAPATLPSISTTALSTSPVGTYPITASGAIDANYTITYVPGALTVTAIALTITATNQSKCEETTANLGTTAFISVGLVNGDAITSVTLSSTGAVSSATKSSPGPNYPIVPSAAIGSGLSNYNITYTNGTLTITSPTLLFVPTNSPCFGDLGGATLTAIGGGGSPYTFTSSPSTNVTITGNIMTAPAGVYVITVTDGAGCTKNGTLTITQPPVISGTSQITSNYNGAQLSCLGATDGKIMVTASGGTGAYQYSVDNGAYQTSNILMNLGAGTHTLKVKDANGCEVNLPTSDVIIAPTAITTATASKTNVVCYGESTGTITLAGAGGTPPYAYTITGTGSNTTGATTGNFTDLPSGTYSYSITDANNCSPANGSLTIAQPIAVTVSGIATNVSCNGLSDGSIAVTNSDGSTVVITNASNVVVSNFDLPAGIYTLTATAADGNSVGSCTATATVTITQPIAVTVSGIATNVSCNGLSDGLIAVSNGVGSTVVIRNAGNSVVSNSGLPAGIYTLTATAPDGNNGGLCIVTASVTITQPIPVTVNGTATNVSCNGLSDGSIMVSNSTGSTVVIRNASNVVVSNTGLPVGTYTLTAISPDGNNVGSCTATTTITITQPIAITVSGVATNANCNGATTGSIAVNNSVGSSVVITNASNTVVGSTGLSAGTYTLTATAANGNNTGSCTATTTVTIEQPAAITASTAAKTDVTCIGGSNGVITLVGAGGTSPYTYTITGTGSNVSGVTSGNFTELIAGTYNYSITDANNCSAAAGSLIVGQPDPMIVTGPTADVCPGSSIVFDVISTINDAYDFDWTAKDATNASLGSDSFVNLGLGAVNTTLSLSCGTPINNPITFTFTPSTTGGCVGTSITRTVYVRDLVAPNFTRPANITISTNASCTYDASVTATGDVTDEADNCSTSLQATYTDNTVQGATTGSYLITRTWSLVDACGNAAATQNQIIVVNDNTPPTTPTLADVTGECSATAIIATTTDACSGTITGTTTDPLTYSTQGTHVIHWTFTDESGNTITANQNVIIKDINNPVTPTLADITAQCSATVTAPTTTDNCVGTVTGTTTTIFPITTQGTTVVAWTFDDGNGNSIIVNQNVIITDNIAPVAPVSLADVTEECSATPTAPTATDNCAGTVTGITTTEFPITAQGTTVVTWTFDDGHGNSSTVTQNVILHDVTQPVLVDVPANISVNNETDLCTKVVTFTPPSATDNCTIPTLTQTAGLPSGSAFPIGTTTNTFSVTDNGGNITTASFDVVVTDSQFPTITAPANIIVCEGTSVSTLGTPTTTDNCPLPIDAVTNNNTVTVPGVFPIGVTTIVWTVTDATGHITTANQTVTVNALPTVSITSNNSPICTGASATFTLSGTANAVVTYSLDGGTTTASVTLDNSGAGTVTITEATANQTLTLVSALIGTTNCSKTFTETSTITVNQLPTLTVVNPAAVCSPATVDITANTVQTANTGTTTNYYSTNASAMAGGTGDILTPTAIATGSTVYIRSESVAGCYIIQPVTVVVNPLPTLTVVNPTALCSPATVDITTATVQIANTGTTTNYYSTNALAITGGRGDISTPTAIASSTTIYIRSELATSCYVIQPVTVTVNQLPTLTVVNPAAVCSPATVDITANTVQTANTGTTTNYYSTNASAMAGGTGDILTPTAIATGSTVYIRSESVAGCYIIQPVTVVVNPLPTLTTTSTNSSCNGASNGTITVTTSATSPIFSKDGGTTYVSGPNPYSFSTLAGGTYSIRVKDANTCESVVSSVTLTQPDVIDVTAIPTAALCFGGNGSAALSATGGSGIYTFTSTGGTVTGNSLSAPAGTYTITATDGNNCTGTFSVTIGQSAAALSATTSKVNVLCKGGATGTATVLATGGTIGTGYTYSWNTSPVQTTATATGLVAGTYTVTITDANGCTFSPAVVVISEPTTATSITASGSSHICEASALTLTSTPVSSTGGLTYAWSGPNAFAATTQNASIAVTTLAAAGIYMITVKDANSCIATATTSVVINPLPTIYTVSGTGVICSGIASPITLSGSTVGINYKLAAIGFFGSVLAGTGSALVFTPPSNILATYTIEAINAATGCKVLMAGSVSTINATNPTITITAQTNVSCFGGNNGSVTAVASAGSGTYTYTFNGGISQPTGVFSGKTAGTYPIVATDTNTGCIGSINAVITQPATLPSVTVASSGIACVGNTVTLTATATGGTGTTYMYNWNGTGFVSTPTLAVTSTSTNTLVVKDVNGCTSSTVLSTTVTFNTPTPPTIAGSTTLCSGSTLSLSTSAVGTYAWSGPNAFTSASASISIANVQAVNADTYTVTVTDANSCIASATANVVINITPTISITPTTAILSCTTPSTIITAIGATIYSWTGTGGFTATTAAATITAGGTYVVTGVANGCSATASVIVTENKVTPTITITPTTAILTCLNPTALVTASGASTYSWTGAGGFTATTAIATITAQGTYVVTGTGSNGCTATSSVIVTEDKTPPTVTVSSTTFILTCLTPSAAVTASGADSYSWTGTRGFTATTAMAIITTAGTYTVIGTNANGCTASVRIAIGQSKTPPTISVTPTTAILTCLTPSTTITASGALTYTWSGTGGFTASTATALITIGGTYTVIGTNGNGCTASASVVITENKVAPTATVTGAGVLCSGSTISLTATGGGTYQWSGSNSFTSTSAAVNIPNATVTNSGTYIVTVTNANGCTASAMATITVNPAIAVPTTQAFASISSGESISLTATGCSGTLLWFKSSDDSPATMPVSPTTMTSYYAKCEVTTNGVTCTSDKSGDVVVTVGIIISIKTGGAWEDPTTWDAGRVPLSTDEVIIDTNHNVIITTLNAVAKKLRYRTNAKVTFANPATKLTILGL